MLDADLLDSLDSLNDDWDVQPRLRSGTWPSQVQKPQELQLLLQQQRQKDTQAILFGDNSSACLGSQRRTAVIFEDGSIGGSRSSLTGSRSNVVEVVQGGTGIGSSNVSLTASNEYLPVGTTLDAAYEELENMQPRERCFTWPAKHFNPYDNEDSSHLDAAGHGLSVTSHFCYDAVTDGNDLSNDSCDMASPSSKKGPKRKNPWGDMSYAEIITEAILSVPEKRLTLSQIYDWMIKHIPYFRQKADSTTSAGWKNSVRHNLSLQPRFVRVQNESAGKSSWWMVNMEAIKKANASNRRRGSGAHTNPTMTSHDAIVQQQLQQLSASATAVDNNNTAAAVAAAAAESQDLVSQKAVAKILADLLDDDYMKQQQLHQSALIQQSASMQSEAQRQNDINQAATNFAYYGDVTGQLCTPGFSPQGDLLNMQQLLDNGGSDLIPQSSTGLGICSGPNEVITVTANALSQGSVQSSKAQLQQYLLKKQIENSSVEMLQAQPQNANAGSTNRVILIDQCNPNPVIAQSAQEYKQLVQQAKANGGGDIKDVNMVTSYGIVTTQMPSQAAYNSFQTSSIGVDVSQQVQNNVNMSNAVPYAPQFMHSPNASAASSCRQVSRSSCAVSNALSSLTLSETPPVYSDVLMNDSVVDTSSFVAACNY